MASAIGMYPRFLILASLVTLTSLWAGGLRADAASLPEYVIEAYGEPPAIPDGPLTEALAAAVQVAFVDSMEQATWTRDQNIALDEIKVSKDPRLVWMISDLMRFVPDRGLNVTLAEAASELLGKQLDTQNPWGAVTDHLIAWNIPEPPDYLRVKRAIFTTVLPGWDKIFVEGDIDWRMVSWGGVLIDDRAYDTTDEQCNCLSIIHI